MDALSWLITLAGVIITLLALIDVFLTVLHVDTDGPVAWMVFLAIWKTIIGIVRAVPTARRSLVALAGPMMIVVTFSVWIGLFIVGFALIYWPHLELFRADNEFVLLGFMEALYFSGVTATVLGYGDLSPMHGSLQIVSFLQSGFGFALLTGIVTYLINVVSGVTDRNALALRLWAETGRTGDGTVAITRSLLHEESGDLRLRLQTLLDATHSIHQKMHQFPILDLFYRSRDPIYSPELMVQTAAQMAIAAQILSTDARHQRLNPVSKELGQVSTEIMELIASQHMSKELQHQLDDPAPEEEDRRLLRQIRRSLTDALPQLNLERAEENDRVLELIFRMRIFLDELDDLTGWRMDQAGE